MKKVERSDLLNLWLKYHNTNVDEVIAKHPKEILESPDWYKLYPCTEEQYDEWKKEAKALIKKTMRISNKFVDKGWWGIELSCSPYIKRTEKPDNQTDKQ